MCFKNKPNEQIKHGFYRLFIQENGFCIDGRHNIGIIPLTMVNGRLSFLSYFFFWKPCLHFSWNLVVHINLAFPDMEYYSGSPPIHTWVSCIKPGGSSSGKELWHHNQSIYPIFILVWQWAGYIYYLGPESDKRRSKLELFGRSQASKQFLLVGQRQDIFFCMACVKGHISLG